MSDKQIVIKKYPNRRLYNTEISNYVTLEDLYALIKKGQNFVVQDVKSGDDLTSLILTQIILEQEIKGSKVLPPDFLRQIIRTYDDSVGSILQTYLDISMKNFENNKERFVQMADNINKSMNDVIPSWSNFEEMTKRNLQFFENTMRMFRANVSNKANAED